MQRFASGPGPFAFFDAPWTPVFLFVLFAFHWLLGVLAVVSEVLLLVLALLNSARTARLQREAGEAAAKAGHFVEQIRAGGETVRGLGMRAAATARSGVLRGASLDQYGEAALADHVGWLPQEGVLFEGSVAENIARLDPSPDPDAVVAAAEHAGAHAMTLDLPGGYDFQVAAGGAALSGGQRQRIALVRSFYGTPAVVILDEPDAALDTAGSAALNRAVAALKARCFLMPASVFPDLPLPIREEGWTQYVVLGAVLGQVWRGRLYEAG